MAFTLRGLPSSFALRIGTNPVQIAKQPEGYGIAARPWNDRFTETPDLLTGLMESLNSPRWGWRFVQLHAASPQNVVTIYNHMVRDFISRRRTTTFASMTASELVFRAIALPGSASDNGDVFTSVRLGPSSYLSVPNRGDMDGMFGFMPFEEAFNIHGTTQKLKAHLKKLSEILGIDFKETDFRSALLSLIKGQKAECERALGIETSEETSSDPYSFEWPINDGSPFQAITLKMNSLFVNATGGISESNEPLSIEIKIKSHQREKAQEILMQLFG